MGRRRWWSGRFPVASLAAVVIVGTLGSAAVGAAPTGEGADRLAGPPPSGAMAAPVRYEVEGELEDIDGEARIRPLAADVTEDRVAALAAALGLRSPVAAEARGWVVSGEDGRRLVVERAPGAPWSYTGSRARPAPEAEPEPERPGPTVAPTSSRSGIAAWLRGAMERLRTWRSPAPRSAQPARPGSVDCPMPPCPPGMRCPAVCPPGDGTTPIIGEDRAARLTAERIFAAAGIDVDAADIAVGPAPSGFEVTADPTVDGLPTVGWRTSVTVGSAGRLVQADGWLAPAGTGAMADLIGTAAALERLRAGEGGGPPEADRPTCEGCVKPELVTLTSVRLGLQLRSVGGAAERFLVPSYLFDAEVLGRPAVYPVVGVDDDRFSGPQGPGVPPGCELIGGDAVWCPPGGGGGGPGGGDLDTDPPKPPGGTPVSCHDHRRGTLTLEVCVSPSRPSAGEEVTFEVVARDREEAVADDCASPLFAPDVDEEVPTCRIGFQPPPGAGPDEVARTFTHVYDEPGEHRAAVSVNASCLAEAPCRLLEVEVPVPVGP